jgi:hypothetical protein
MCICTYSVHYQCINYWLMPLCHSHLLQSQFRDWLCHLPPSSQMSSSPGVSVRVMIVTRQLQNTSVSQLSMLAMLASLSLSTFVYMAMRKALHHATVHGSSTITREVILHMDMHVDMAIKAVVGMGVGVGVVGVVVVVVVVDVVMDMGMGTDMVTLHPHLIHLHLQAHHLVPMILPLVDKHLRLETLQLLHHNTQWTAFPGTCVPQVLLLLVPLVMLQLIWLHIASGASTCFAVVTAQTSRMWRSPG